MQKNQQGPKGHLQAQLGAASFLERKIKSKNKQ
jgi:hypothetical protein